MKKSLYILFSSLPLVLLISSIFYLICPKYKFTANGGAARYNKITGKVELFKGGQWKSLEEIHQK